jgi:hypothetical protein
VYHPKIISASQAKLEERLGHELRRSTVAEVDEALYRMRNVDWSRGLNSVVPTLPADLQEFITAELLLSKIDARYWFERYAMIQDDAGRLVRLRPWPSQEQILRLIGELELAAASRDAIKIALIILKARQIGGTAISEALIAHMVFFNKNTRSGIASDHPDNSKNLWDVFVRIHENLPPWMKPRASAKAKATNLHLDEMDCDVMVGAGNQKTTFGQGVTFDCGHMTELSTWLKPNTDQLEADLIPAFKSSKKHHSLLVYESTAEGASGNYFHDVYQSARKGKSIFKPTFLAWWSAPQKYSEDPEGVTITENVTALAEMLEREEGVTLTRGQLAWYQKTYNHYHDLGNDYLMLQEYPSTPDEAFQTGHRSVFPLEVRTQVRRAARPPIAILEWLPGMREFVPVQDSEWIKKAEQAPELYNNHLLIYEKARAGYVYACGVDSSYGLEQDSSTVEVVRVGNRAEPAEQVAEFATNTLDPVELAAPAMWIGKYYEDTARGRPALMAPESSPGSPGISTLTQMVQAGYGNFYVWRKPTDATGRGWKTEVGWHTTNATRPLLTDVGVNAIIKGRIKINSLPFCREMDSFIEVFNETTGHKKKEHAPGNCDDRIFGVFIAFYVSHEDGTLKVAESAFEQEASKHRTPDNVVQFQQVLTGPGDSDLFEEWEERYGG